MTEGSPDAAIEDEHEGALAEIFADVNRLAVDSG
jgi:hypothetical protein